MSTSRWSRRKITIAVLALVGILALVGTTVATMLMPFLQNDRPDVPSRASATPTATEPRLVIKPLAVRMVTEAFQAQPGQCDPPPPPLPPNEPQAACDVARKAHYQLEPVSIVIGLTNAKALKLPTMDTYGVQIVMDGPSSAAFAKYTTANVGKQVAFVRDGLVLAAPSITDTIDGQSIQLSGDMTKDTADTIAKLLRDGS
ncbi:SecDF P1 head subdomain-containing protein [Mycolicibacterium sediminis]